VTAAEATADVAVGTALLAAGVLALRRARASMTGPLLLLAGVAWLAGDATPALAYAHRGVLVHALLTFPTGRTRSRTTALVVTTAYVDGLVPGLARSPWPTLALLVAVVGTAIWRWATARGVRRRTLQAPLWAAIAVAVPLTAAAVGRLAGADLYVPSGWLYQASVVLTASVLVLELHPARSVRSATTGLIVDLAGRQGPRVLRDALSRTVGDPALQVAFKVDDEWVDESGHPARLPDPAELTDRVVTYVREGAGPVAAIAHDQTALQDPTLAGSVSAAVRLVLANVRLQAEDAARMREVSESRRRLVEAGDEQRRLLREELRAGAERILSEVSCDLSAVAASRPGDVGADLASLVRELEASRRDLDDFAQGVHPRALTEKGLAVALVELAAQAAVPVAVDVPSRRFPGPQEAAVYFVCSEALANVAKYAEATRASIHVRAQGSRLVVVVSDDGRGGADPSRGSGLRGLLDRVEAFGGTLSVVSPDGAGTRVKAELPADTEEP
jgi:signal transduction histidine kinase